MFADAVAAALEGGVLRYSARAELLRLAGRMRIERFEANLIIAAVQHRLRGNRLAGAHARPRTRWGVGMAYFAAIVVVQAVIVAGAWWMLAGF
jgi:hypothetical protein